MADALSYSILNKIFRLLQTAVDVEDTVTIESKTIDITYNDIKAGRLYPVYIASLPDRCCLLHSQLNVVTPFSTSTNPVLYAQFNLGVDIQETVGGRDTKSKYGLIYNGLNISSAGIKSPNGILVGKQKSRVINYGKNDLVAYFSLLGVWSVATSISYARYFPSGTGSATSTLVVGGGTYSPTTPISSCEQYNGSVWTMGATPPRNLIQGGAVGTSIGSSMIIAGCTSFSYDSSYSYDTSYYNGTSWVTGLSAFPIQLRAFSSFGTYNAAVAATGYSSSVGYQYSTYEFTSLSWHQSSDVNIVRTHSCACGSIAAGLLTGGYSPTVNSDAHYSTEEYNGISWTIGNDMTTARRNHACSGTFASSVVSNGMTISNNWSVTSEEYDGTSWLTSGSSLHNRYSGTGSGANASSILDISGIGYPTGEAYWSAIEDVEHYTKSSLYNLTAGQMTLFLTYCYT